MARPDAGKNLCDALLAVGVEIKHACDGVSACSTCHIIIREGYRPLSSAEEEDQLDKACGLTPCLSGEGRSNATHD
ncbi:MAG: 2Fe-2S iron-sulfur cluster-binding protein [Methylotenera sp.]|nr:2Fe-2S iron-sulfur cluster-binding protein [Methylotenera sp.]